MRVLSIRTQGPLVIAETPGVAGVTPGARRRGLAAEPPILPLEFQDLEKVSVEKTFTAALDPTVPVQRGASLPAIEMDVQAETPDEAPLVVLRYPSGAITFHPGLPAAGPSPAAGTRRSGTAGAKPTGGMTYQFRIPLRQAQTSEGRRGLIADVIKAAVLTVTKPVIDKAVSFALPELARLWEQRAWDKHRISEGWFHVVPPSGANSMKLEAGRPEPGHRNLLLLHGTFSNAESAFGSLARTNFFPRIASIYGDRIYAFNHFSVSRSTEENAAALLAGLPDGKCQFDVITHSRGGLVLRTLVERVSDLGPNAGRFNLGRAILVASPNDGTPLATPDRWDQTIGWIANLLKIVEAFSPENPFLTGAEFVAEGLVWLAHHLAGDLPGLRSMDRAGEIIEALQGPPAPPAHGYGALVANFQPDQHIWQIMVDAGVDQFFGSANDLVVPSEGGWRIDRDGSQHVDVDKVGVFGPGGNINPAEPAGVMHTNFFQRQETADFLFRSLAEQPLNLPAVNLDAPLPDRRFVRAISAVTGAGAPRPTGPVGDAGQSRARAAGPDQTLKGGLFNLPSTAARDTFTIAILTTPALNGTGHELAGNAVSDQHSTGRHQAIIFAAYGGARVVEPFALSGGQAGKNWQSIISLHEAIKDFTQGKRDSLPSDSEMENFGKLLFNVLFPGDVKRLYDTARSLQAGRRMDLVFTSMIPWVAEKPWEFAFDPGRQTHLATEEIHFVRNVLTQIPGDSSVPRPGPLQILVVSAQPVGTVELSIDEETELIRQDFATLTEAGLAQINVIARATIAQWHSCLAMKRYNVVHFIGHGGFDDTTKQGRLLLQGTSGAPPEMLDERSARELLCGRGVDLVFLNACQTSTSSAAGFNSGLAQSLVAHGLPALVANQYSVGDTAATSFSQFFYWGLARGLSFGAAAREARISVNYSIDGPAVIDWAVPVLYARDPNSVLTTGVSSGSPVMPVTHTGRSARSARTHKFTTAVWDVDRVLPNLPSIVDRMNRAQNCFGFQLANLSAPIDAFKTIGGVRYLWKERVAERLRSRPGEYGADALLCLTHYKLSKDGDREPYAWWPENLYSPVLIFSYSGLAIDPNDPGAARALTNAIVKALAATRGKVAVHESGPETCPMFANLDRNVTTMTAPQQFDANCRKRILAAADGGELLKCLGSLLGVFNEAPPASEGKTATAAEPKNVRGATKSTGAKKKQPRKKKSA